MIPSTAMDLFETLGMLARKASAQLGHVPREAIDRYTDDFKAEFRAACPGVSTAVVEQIGDHLGDLIWSRQLQ